MVWKGGHKGEIYYTMHGVLGATPMFCRRLKPMKVSETDDLKEIYLYYISEGTDWKAGFEAIAKTAAAQMSTDTIASQELKG